MMRHTHHCPKPIIPGPLLQTTTMAMFRMKTATHLILKSETDRLGMKGV